MESIVRKLGRYTRAKGAQLIASTSSSISRDSHQVPTPRRATLIGTTSLCLWSVLRGSFLCTVVYTLSTPHSVSGRFSVGANEFQ
ncbi:hypothetical protein BR93DRAFT_487931 [Coniochaeta sp. PMI_546]|nr:hypothetical protein BR93DRAFT_487931 [Coniochaeta sp. PMI_546]